MRKLNRAASTVAVATVIIGATIAAPYAADKETSKMPAVATASSTNPNAPVDGRNSFTHGQVTARLTKAGYGNIRDLVKGSDGIWRANADKGGMTHKVMFDYQGNITTEASSTTIH